MFTMFAVYQERGGDRIQCTFTEPSLDECRFEVDDVLWEACGWLTLVWSGTLEQAHDEALAVNEERYVGGRPRSEYERKHGDGHQYFCGSALGCDDSACHQCFPDEDDM